MCERWEPRLSELIDGEMEAHERETLETHLLSCASCRATADELRRVVRHARSLPDLPPAGDLWPGIAAAIRQGSPPARPSDADSRPRRLRRARPRAAVAAALAMLVAGLTLTGGPAWGWISERLAEVAAPARTAAISDRTDAERNAPARGRGAGGAASSDIAVFRLLPGEEDLVLEFDSHQVRGSLEVRVERGEQASLVVLGPGADAITTTPSGFRVRNVPGTAADYHLTIPMSLRSVQVRIGDPDDVYVIRDLYLPLRWVFGLQQFD